MSLLSKIADGWGTGNKLKVQPEGEIGVVVHTHPPVSESRIGLPFRQYFTVDGTPSGSNAMNVDGSTNPVEFCIPASDEYDLYIKTISIKLGDTGAAFDEFGNLPALTNGVQFVWQSQEVGEIEIHDGIKDNLEFFRLAGQEPVIVDLSGGGADAVVVFVDLSVMFGSPWGVKLTKGTTEKFIWRINDDLGTGITTYNKIGYGTRV